MKTQGLSDAKAANFWKVLRCFPRVLEYIDPTNHMRVPDWDKLQNCGGPGKMRMYGLLFKVIRNLEMQGPSLERTVLSEYVSCLSTKLALPPAHTPTPWGPDARSPRRPPAPDPHLGRPFPV